LGWEYDSSITQQYQPEKLQQDTPVEAESTGLDWLNTGDL